MKLKLTIILLGFSFFINNLQAQIQANNAMYDLNPTYYNPAAAGMQLSAFNIAINSRANWVAFNSITTTNNPWNAMVSIDKRFDEKHIGIGVNVCNINRPGLNFADIAGNLSYFVNLRHEIKLSFGLKAGINYINADKAYIETDNGTDTQFKNFGNFIIPKLGLGLHLKGEKFWAGVASPDIITYDKQGVLAASSNTFKRLNLNVNAGYKFMLNNDLYLKPSVFSIFLPTNTNITNVNMSVGKDELYWCGLGYSHLVNWSVMAGITLNGRYNLAYSFSRNNGNLSTSHELMLTWDLEDAL